MTQEEIKTVVAEEQPQKNPSDPSHPENKQGPKFVDVRSLKTSFFDPVVWEQMKGIAETFRASGAFPAEDSAPKIMVKLQAGREMGMTPVESIKSFYFVKGTINIFGAAVVRRLREHGWIIEYQDESNKCTATITKGEEKHTDVLTFEEAEKSGWTKGPSGLKPGWYEGVNRRLKLRYGVASILIRTYAPEVLGSASDIAEVAIDAATIYDAYESQIPDLKDGDRPATAEQIETLVGLDPEFKKVVEKHLDEGTGLSITKQEAAQRIKDAASKKARKS